MLQLSTDTSRIDFGTTVIGETLKRTFTLTNKGALGTKFEFFKVTGQKERTVTTAATSLGGLVSKRILKRYKLVKQKLREDKIVGQNKIFGFRST